MSACFISKFHLKFGNPEIPEFFPSPTPSRSPARPRPLPARPRPFWPLPPPVGRVTQRALPLADSIVAGCLNGESGARLGGGRRRDSRPSPRVPSAATTATMLAEQENQENVPPGGKAAAPPAAVTRVALGLLRGGQQRAGLPPQVR